MTQYFVFVNIKNKKKLFYMQNDGGLKFISKFILVAAEKKVCYKEQHFKIRSIL